jgi:hypothetical protein
MLGTVLVHSCSCGPSFKLFLGGLCTSCPQIPFLKQSLGCKDKTCLSLSSCQVSWVGFYKAFPLFICPRSLA